MATLSLVVSGQGQGPSPREYADFTKDFVDFARASLKAGKTVEPAATEYKVAPRFKGYEVSVSPSFGGALTNLKIAYGELKK